MSIRRSVARLALAGVWIGSLGALALSGQEASEEPIRLEETRLKAQGPAEGYGVGLTTTGSKLERSPLEIPRSLAVVPRQALDDQLALDLEEALRNASGMGFVQGGEGAQVFSRGLGATTLKNGFPTSEFSGGDIRGSDLDTYNLERIEVFKGPSSVLYGRGNPGGTLNLITKKPREESHGSLSAIFDDEGSVRFALDAGGPLARDGSVSVRLPLLYEEEESFRRVVESETFALSPSAAFDLSERATLLVEGEYFDEESIPDGGIPGLEGEPFPGVSNKTFLGNPGDLRELEKWLARVELAYQAGESWRWRLALRASDDQTEENFNRPDGVEEDGATATRSFITSEFDLADYRIQADATGSFRLGPTEHTLVFGGEAGTREVDVLFAGGPSSGIDIFDPQFGPSGRQSPPNFTFVAENERDFFAFFVQDEIRLSDRWTVVAGARYDDTEEDTVNGLVGNLGEQPTQADEELSPNVGVVYRPSQSLSLYANWSESFQAINGVPADESGEILDAETATLWEAGAKWQPAETGLTATLALYNILLDNRATREPGQPFQTDAGELESQGLEVDVTGEIAPGWSVVAAYAFTDAEILRDGNASLMGNRPKEVPRHSGRLWSFFRFQGGALEGLGFGGGATYVGERFATDANAVEFDYYWRLDAAMSYEREGWTARLKIENLLDDDDIVLNAARGSFIRIAEGVNATASLGYRF